MPPPILGLVPVTRATLSFSFIRSPITSRQDTSTPSRERMTTRATDIHTHIVPASFPAYAGRHANVRWPSMAPAHDCHHCNVMIAGKVFRTVSDHSWSLERRLEVMEASRVERQVLSPMPELLSYWLEPEDAES